jgi:hypothetical protein
MPPINKIKGYLISKGNLRNSLLASTHLLPDKLNIPFEAQEQRLFWWIILSA